MHGSADLSLRTLASVAAAASVAVGALAWSSAWDGLELKAFDALTVTSAPQRSRLPITIVGIDEASFAQVGRQWPWPRSVHARLLDQLTKAGALVVAFDVVMSEAAGPQDDDALARSISRSGGAVVLAADMAYQETSHSRQWLRVDPLPAFVDAGAARGLAAITLDPDLVVRRLPEEPDAFWRQIVARVNARHPGLLSFEEPSPGAMIRYAGPDHTFPYVSYYQALDPDTLLPPGALKDQIILVGRDVRATPDAGAAQADLFATPFLAYTRWLTPGAEIHANVLETAIRGDALQRAPRPWSLMLVLAAVAVCAWAMRRWRPLGSAAIALGFAVAIVAFCAWLFVARSVWLPVVAPLTAIAVMYVALGGAAFVGESRRRGELRRAFALYVSPEVVDHVMAHPERLALGGDRRRVTVLFTDLEGFTALSERLGPEQVARLLNLHFTRATAIIKRHGGTVNRFIGDAIMAMWGAPVDDPRQALRAVHAACAMQEDLVGLRAQLQAEGLPPIRMRIGIHTCMAVVGNLGSSDRFDYTAIGDGVNLAARLEGVNKLYRTDILLTADTVALLEDAPATRLVDRVVVKGKSQPVDIYTPSADAALNDATARAIAAFRSRRWDESEAAWAALLRDYPGDAIAALYVERIVRFRVTLPAADWQGAVELDKL
jgi:adenylate cyclase